VDISPERSGTNFRGLPTAAEDEDLLRLVANFFEGINEALTALALEIDSLGDVSLTLMMAVNSPSPESRAERMR